jgi:hypothetical protein
LRLVFRGDIGCFPFSTPGGDQHENDLQPGYGDRYLSGFLLLDHFCGEPHVRAGLGAAEVLRQMLPNGYARQPGASRIAGLCLRNIVWQLYWREFQRNKIASSRP